MTFIKEILQTLGISKTTLFFIVGIMIFDIMMVLIISYRLNKKKGGIFSYENINFVVKELMKMYSDKPSFFSKKRIESGIAFIVAEHGALYALVAYVKDIQDFAIWFGLQIPIIVYTVYKIEQSKTNLPNGEQKPAG